MLNSALLLLATFVLGGVNVAVLLSSMGLIPDPRRLRSGNPGVSNVYRTAGPLWAGVVLSLDVGRAVGVALLCLGLMPPSVAPWGAPVLVLANRFPVFHGLRGGKGVANLIGFAVGSSPLWGGLAVLVWPAAYAVLRVTYLSSFVLVAVLTGVLLMRFGPTASSCAAMAVTVGIIVWGHRKNVGRGGAACQ